MPQTTQIIPKWTFPHVESVINDYTIQDEGTVEATADTSVKQAYAFNAGKGIDRVWVKKSSRESGVKTFGESNFKTYGQPLMQALNVLDQDNTSVWCMRITAENATYANSIVSAYIKADSAADFPNPLDRKFRIKLTAKSVDGILTSEDLEAASKVLDGSITNGVYTDAEGFVQQPFMTVRAAGHGKYGNDYSLRISTDSAYEGEFGIKLYDFEVLNSASGLVKEANYVGAAVTSAKYYKDGITLINDILDDAEVGLAPLDVRVDEDAVEAIYDQYIEFAKGLNEELVAAYETFLEEEFNSVVRTDVVNNIASPTDEEQALLDKRDEYEAAIDSTTEGNLPALDEFDIFFGIKPDSTDGITGIKFVKTLTPDVDTTADDYVAADYTNDEVVDFTSTAGLTVSGGDDGYFAEPRIEAGVQWTLDQEIEKCLINAYSGVYDKRILSTNRMELNALFDANYPYSVKLVMFDLVKIRNVERLFLDTGIVNTISLSQAAALKKLYSIFDYDGVSVDCHNYKVRESSTGKRANVTISYLLSEIFCEHLNAGMFYKPMVKDNCQLRGHVRDSLLPVIDDYEPEIKEFLNKARINYFEPVADNVFQRAIQNTTQISTSDLLEENNSQILRTLRRNIEKDANAEIYNFSDTDVRQTFIETEEAKYENWMGTYVENFELSFSTSQYEFNHSIMHLYLGVTFRGLDKIILVEVDINKRTMAETDQMAS